MPLSIKSAEADELARKLAAHTGETLTQAVINALRERLRRLEGIARPRPLHEALMEISRRASALPVVGPGDGVEYDEHGLPR